MSAINGLNTIPHIMVMIWGSYARPSQLVNIRGIKAIISKAYDAYLAISFHLISPRFRNFQTTRNFFGTFSVFLKSKFNKKLLCNYYAVYLRREF